MAKLFSFRRPRSVIVEQQNDPSAGHTRPISKLLNKTKHLFRRNNVVEPLPPFRPLPVPTLTAPMGGLQEEIDGELLLLNERDIPFTSDFEQHIILEHEALSVRSSPRNAFTPPSIVSAGSDNSDGHAADLLSNVITSGSNYTSNPLHDETQIVDATQGGAIPSPSDGLLPESTSRESAADLPVLDFAEDTGSNARTPLPSSEDSLQLTPTTPTDALAAGSTSDTRIDRVVDGDLRQEVGAVEALNVKSIHNDRRALVRSHSLSTPVVDITTHRGLRRARIIRARSAHLSTDLANVSFFRHNLADESAFIGLSSLFAEREPSEGANPTTSQTEPSGEVLESVAGPGFVCFAQSQLEVDIIRRNRCQFAKSLQIALAEQEARLTSSFQEELVKQQDSLERSFEESYDGSAKLHEIEILNLQDDHEAEVTELKQTTKDLRARVANTQKSVRGLRRELKSLSDGNSATENQLQERSSQCTQLLQAVQDRETLLQSQVEDLYETREELARTRQESAGLETSLRAPQAQHAELRRLYADLCGRYNGLQTEFNQLDSDRQESEAQLATTRRQLEAAQTTLQEREKSLEDLRALYDHVVTEKVRDFSWHVQHDVNPLAMKPMNTKEEIAEATKLLRERLEEETEATADLRLRLEAAQAAGKTRSKKLKRVVANQSQEMKILEMALTIAQGQRDHWAGQYDEIAEAVTSKIHFSSFERSLAERHLALQKTRFALEVQLLESKVHGDRAVLDCTVGRLHEGIKLAKRDAQIANLKQELRAMTVKFDNENGMALLYKDVIDKEMPALRNRNDEVEHLLEDQIVNNVNAHHEAVFNDLHSRLHGVERTNQYYEHVLNNQLQEHGTLQTDYSFFAATVHMDLVNAHGWRNDRDRLELENVAFRARFADELRNEPLVIPAGSKTRQQIEDDFKLESINDLLLEQYGTTYGAIPKQLLDVHASPWEHIRVEMKGDIAEQKQRWIEQRDALIDTFKDDDNVEMPNDHECIDTESEFEAAWKGKGKGKGKASGGGSGADGQIEASGVADEDEDPIANFF